MDRDELKLDAPFCVKSEIEALLHGLLEPLQSAVLAESHHRGGLSIRWAVAPNRLLEERWAEKRELLWFFEGVAPQELIEELEQGRRGRNLLLRCPEILAEAYGRADLAALVVASRRRVLETLDVFTLAEPFLGQDCLPRRRGQKDQIRIVAVQRREGAERRVPWLDFFLHRALQRARHSRVVDVTVQEEPEPQDPDMDALLQKLIDSLDALSADTSEPPTSDEAEAINDALVTIAALLVPGICLNDVREMIRPAGLSSGVWAGRVLDLAGQHQSALLDIYPEATEEQWVQTSPGDRRSLTPEAQQKLIASPSTRLLWHSSVQHAVAEVIWQRWAGPAGHKLRVHLKRLHDGLRRRFKQTRSRHYQWVALVLRLLSAPPETERTRFPSGKLHAACKRFVREVHALRMLRNPWSEAQLHAWLRPHVHAMKHAMQTSPAQHMWKNNRNAFQFLTLQRIEYEFMTLLVLYTTLCGWLRPKLDDRGAQGHGDARWRSEDDDALREYVAPRIAALSEMLADDDLRPSLILMARKWPPPWFRNALGPLTLAVAHVNQTLRDGPNAGWSETDILDRALVTLNGFLASPEIVKALDEETLGKFNSEDPEIEAKPEKIIADLNKHRRASSENGDDNPLSIPGLLVFAAQTLLRRAAADTRDSKTPGISPKTRLAADLLRKALSFLEMPLHMRSYVAVRCMLGLDLRIVERRFPDMTFLTPLLGYLDERAGEEVTHRLQDEIRRTFLRALVARDEEYLAAKSRSAVCFGTGT
jgi:hypothetical protein